MANAKKSKTAQPLSLVTEAEVEAAKSACLKFQRAYHAQKKAEKAREAAIAQLFFKMGLTTSEVKAMDPAKLAAVIHRRCGIEFDFASPSAAEFAILKTWEGGFPKWKEAFLSIASPEMVADVEAEVAKSYSYSIIGVDKQPSGIYILPKP